MGSCLLRLAAKRALLGPTAIRALFGLTPIRTRFGLGSERGLLLWDHVDLSSFIRVEGANVIQGVSARVERDLAGL